jgi:hypothetical protein
MRKAMIAGAVLVALAGCNKLASKENGDAAATTSTAAVGSTSTTGAGSIVDKALSFLTGGPFEGAITMTMTDAGKPAETIVYEVKGDKMRFDRPTGPDPGYVIMEGKKLTSVDEKKKIAIVMDMSSMPGGPGGPAAAAMASKKPTIDKTGKTETIAGYSCEIWKITEQNGEKSDACMAKGIAFPSMGKETWMSELVDQKLFPLRVVVNDATGKEKSRMEVTKIDKKSIEDGQFQVPAGYKTQSMEDMMKSFGAAMGHPHPH